MTPIRNPQAGFSLLELMISMSILTIVLAGLMTTVISVQRGYVEQRERVRAQESLRAAQMTLVTILRAAGARPNANTANPAAGLFPDPDNDNVFDDLRVVTDFNPINGSVADPLEDVGVWVANDTLWVRWQAGAAAQALAAPIHSLRFHYYANDGYEYTDKTQVAGATRARFVIEAPRDPRSGSLERIESWWVHLRNRSGT